MCVFTEMVLQKLFSQCSDKTSNKKLLKRQTTGVDSQVEWMQFNGSSKTQKQEVVRAGHTASSVRRWRINRTQSQAIKPQDSDFSSLLPPAKLCIRKVPQPSQGVSSFGGQLLNHMIFLGTFLFKPQQVMTIGLSSVSTTNSNSISEHSNATQNGQ